MQTPIQLTIRSLTLTVVSVMVILAVNLIPTGEMQTFVLALDDTTSNTTKIEYTGTPGETVKGQIVIKNPSTKAKKIRITLENPDDKLIDQNNLNSAANLYECCKSWIVLPKGESYTIRPHQKTVIPYEMNIPLDAEAKNYYGAFIVTEVGEKNETPLTEALEGAKDLAGRHCNLILLKIIPGFNENLGMAGASDNLYNASEINLYSPVFAILAALMLALGLTLGVRWCLKILKP